MTDVIVHSAVQTAQRKAAMYSAQRTLETKGLTDRQRSSARANAQFSDTTATAFTEQWANLSSWTQNTSTGLQVANGRLYSGTTQNGGSSANHSFAVSATGQMRALFNHKLAGGSFSGQTIVGISSAAAGAAPAGGGADAKGLSFKGDGTVLKWDNGTATSLGNYNLTKDYTVAVIADGAFLSVIASPTDGSAGEFRARWTQSTVTINNLFVFNSDTRALTGASIGPVGAVKSLGTITPKAGIEGVTRTVHWSQKNGNNFKVSLPANYDSRVPSPLAICFHGNGSDEHLYSDNIDSNATAVGNALNNAGYIVLTAAYTPNTSTWGAQDSLDAYYDAYVYTRDNYNIGPVVIHADSMGGIESLLTLAEKRIPGIVAWFGSSPTANLNACYTTGGPFAATIRAAYGIASDGSDYATKTVGHDPALMSGDAFRGIPMRFYAATDDTAVLKSVNTDVLAPIIAPYSSDLSVTSVTGGHGSGQAFPASTIVAFFNKYAA